MSGLSIRHGEWVVVCDGAKALVLENAGDDIFPNLKTLEVYEQKDPATHEQGTDKPGRVRQFGLGSRTQRRRTDRLARPGGAAFLTRARQASRRGSQCRQGEVDDHRRAAARARHAAPGLFARAQRRDPRRDRQGSVKMPVHEIEKHLSRRRRKPIVIPGRPERAEPESRTTSECASGFRVRAFSAPRNDSYP